jgi:predicted DNA-binding protein (MmcQ/YjbR family)
MNIEWVRDFCLSVKAVTEDVKWESNLCFLVGEKIFCMTSLEAAFRVSIKVLPEDFEILTTRHGIVRAPYLARGGWVSITDPQALTSIEWKDSLQQSYKLIAGKLSKKEKLKLGLKV